MLNKTPIEVKDGFRICAHFATFIGRWLGRAKIAKKLVLVHSLQEMVCSGLSSGAVCNGSQTVRKIVHVRPYLPTPVNH